MEISPRTKAKSIMKCSSLRIKAVLFDLGNTLVYSYPEVTLQRILVEQGIAKPLDEVTDALIRGNAEFDIEKHEGLSAHEFYTQWNTIQLKHLGLKGPKARKLAGLIDSNGGSSRSSTFTQMCRRRC